jgi:hypothetical protein
LTDREVLALKFTLTVAQEVVAVEAGYQSWAELKAASARAPKTPRASSGQPFLKNVTPILLVRDVKTCAAFFQQKLGFEIDFLHGLPPFLRRGIARRRLSAHPLRAATLLRTSRRSGEIADLRFH